MIHPLWSRIILAADYEETEKILTNAARFNAYLRWIKIGIIPFLAAGPDIIRKLKREGWNIFLDLKFHDIPHSVAGAVRLAARYQVDMVNVHAIGGHAMLKAAVQAKNDLSPSMRLIAVTVLTSHDSIPWNPKGSIPDTVVELARWAHHAGLDGVVCSPHEIENIKKSFGPTFLTVTPGIRFNPPDDDQKRWMPPHEAFQRGADFIVMGRSLMNLSEENLQQMNEIFFRHFPLQSA